MNSDNTLASLAMKAELRELVDRFSVLADRKEALAQTRLFTQNAIVETFVAGKSVSRLEGREAIGKAFDRFLNGFDIVYHFNGQHLVTVDGETATGDLYCMTYLFSTEESQKFRTTIGVRYRDAYVRQNGAWLIAGRTSFFDWRQKEKTD